ncbi:GNAT family N-acetyltransferase [Coralloluteibacterium stylophorae]|uniref:GNAT family N-acetyltransferase n=1 Tax=Coralloluteibacterium stylophorae TaxID=1776034 RepID=A0A8J7VXL0_9GAMM|nr:GNAT family N-acetyltransferase [Coralloluteibacterium stylophorae]
MRELLLARPIRDYAVHGFGRLACIDLDSGHLIGFCGLKFSEELGAIDIGYRFVPECWGKGYATESARAVIDDHVMRHGATRIVAVVDPANAGSINVLHKLGLEFERPLTADEGAGALHLYSGRFGDA